MPMTMPNEAAIRTKVELLDSSDECDFLWNHFPNATRAPMATETILAHETNATKATKGPNNNKLPIGNMVTDRRTGAKKTLAKVMNVSCSMSALVRGRVAGRFIAPDEINPVVDVRLRKNTTTKLIVRYTVKPTAIRASGLPIDTSKAEAANAMIATIPKIMVVIA